MRGSRRPKTRMNAVREISIRVFGAGLAFLRDLSRTVPGRLVWMTVAAWAFLRVPDLDLALLGVLHHRSIVTHSVLIPFLVLAIRRRAGAPLAVGAMVGTSVHLACDMLSPMQGFAQIWLPAPVKMPLGALLSWIWLGANAALGFVIALRIAMTLLPRWLGLPFVLALSAVIGARYGALNEDSLAAVAISTALPAVTAAWVLRKRVRRRRP